MAEYPTGARKPFTATPLYRGGVNIQTLTDAKTLDAQSSTLQALDPGGAARDVTMPALEDGLWFGIYNAADAAEPITVKTAAAATIVVLQRGESCVVACDGSAWSVIGAPASAAVTATIAAATGTAIPVTRSGSFPITQNGAETNTLAIPTFLGQTLTIFVDTDTSGARVITSAQRINQAGNTIITLTEVGDFIKLEAITIGGALRWQVVANDGAVLS